MKDGITFDDVLLQPNFSNIVTRKNVNVSTRLTKNIKLNIPIISANMDTITESKMAIAMAELGGIGIIHRFLTIEQQVNEVKKVKRSHNFIIENPYSICENENVNDAKELMKRKGIKSLIVKSSIGTLRGILTNRDLLFENLDTTIEDIMTPLDKLIYEVVDDISEIDLESSKKLLKLHKIEKLPLARKDNSIYGLITAKDIQKRLDYPDAVKDNKGRLLVGASIGVKNDYLERASELVKAGVDVLVIDIAHGHSQLLLDTLYNLKSEFPNTDVIAGNVATKQGAIDLISAGADAIKCGIGGGSTCSTRLVTGSGVPQLTAVWDCCDYATYMDIPVISDGGIRYSGDIVKALSAGASSVMLGSMLAGCEETTGTIRIKDGQKFKVYRGMASFDAAVNRTTAEKGYDVNLDEYVAEGVDTVIPYKGKVKEILNQLTGGLRSGMSYLGVYNIEDMPKNSEFISISSAGWSESKPHGLKN